MITLITGAPGAGKTAALVSMLEDLGKDRAIYAHGIPDLKIPHVVLDDPHTWPDTVPDGAIIIIDEVQTVWRPSGPGQKIPESIQRLETHRHRGLDIYVITQGPNLVHSNVRSLVGRHVHLRDIGAFGRWWYEWPETADNCRTGWKTAPIKKRYKLPRHIFGKYKSASLHTKPQRSFPKIIFVLLAAILGAAALGWQAYSSISAKVNGTPTTIASKPETLPRPPGMPPGPGGFDPLTNTIPAPPTAPGVADELAGYVPRISNRPETAPNFDHLRQIVNMPQVVGAMCTKTRCKCVTNQGTDAGLSEQECRAWLKNPPFNPYSPPAATGPAVASSATAGAGTAPPAHQTAPDPSLSAAAQTVPMISGAPTNPRAEARQARTAPGLPPGLPGSTETRAAPQNLPLRLETTQIPLT